MTTDKIRIGELHDYRGGTTSIVMYQRIGANCF